MAVFFLAFLPQFVDPLRGHVVLQTLLLGTVFTLVGTIWRRHLRVLAGTLGGWLRRPARRRGLTRASGVVFIGLGLSAALPGRPAKA